MTQPPSSSPPPLTPKMAELLARLRAERAASQGAEPLLHHEMAIVEEQTGGEATREFLAAYNADPRFREPLEALVRRLFRRSSPKNLGRLLEALTRSAESSEEKARALCQRAAFLLEHGEAGDARASLEAATIERPDDPTAWLELEILAGRGGDADARARSLEARVELSRDPNWRGLLLIDLAKIEREGGHLERAREFLEAAAALEGIATYPALSALEDLARGEGQAELLAQSLERQAELTSAAMSDAVRGDALGVPLRAREAARVADLWLRAARARKLLGEGEEAEKSLGRALALLPDHPLLRFSRLGEVSDGQQAAELARALLEGEAIGDEGRASLWLRIAEAARESGDSAAALEAAKSALGADRGSILAGLLEADLLKGDPSALAAAIEEGSSALASEGARARALLLAAKTHALGARDIEAAQAALARAQERGASPTLVARASRLFAALLDDSAAYAEATAKLAALVDTPREAESLWFELARRRLVSSDIEGGVSALASLERCTGDLAHLLTAYLPASDDNPALHERRLGALGRLTRDEASPELARAWDLVAAARAEALDDAEGAKERLRRLHEAHPGDDFTAVFLADLEKRSGNFAEAAKLLARTAAEIDDHEFATALRLEAFALASRAGDAAAAIESLEAARGQSPLVLRMIPWALRRAADSAEARKEALARAADAGEEPATIALEDLALRSFDPNEDEPEVSELLHEIEGGGSEALSTAAALSRLILEEDQESSLEKLSSLSPAGRALAAFERLRLARAEGDRLAAEEAARDWAHSEGSLSGALEWLGAAMAREDRDAELSARQLVASSLGGEARSAYEAHIARARFAHAPSEPLPILTGSDAASRLVNLELAPAGADPRRRARALSEIDDALGEDAGVDALLLAGFNQLASGEPALALASFQQVTEARPDELWAWEGVHASAQALEDPRSLAIACAHLGELCQDDARGAEFWERAGLILLDRLNEPKQAELALEQAIARDPSRFVAFDRLFRRVREAGDNERMISLIQRRLEACDDPTELAKLFWEQARALRQQGNRDGALAALESVTAIEPDHVGALALSGEIFITKGQFAEATEALARLATLDEAPDRQRLMSGIAAVDLFENKLGDSIRALEILVALHEAGLSNLPVRERLARAAARTESFRHAASIFEELMNDRPTREGRIEAARLAMALWRDKLEQPKKAQRAAAKLLEEAPGDPEAVDVVLTSPFDPETKRALLKDSRDALLASIARDPVDVERIERLAAVASGLSDLPLRQAALGALIAAGRAEPGADAELADLDQRAAQSPRITLDDIALAKVADPEDSGPIAALFEAISGAIGDALGPSLAALDVGKRERIDPRSGFPVRNEIAAWAGALGLPEVAVYVGGPDSEGVQGVAGDIPSLVIGPNIRAPLSPLQRQAVARELFALRRGTIVSRTRDETTVAALIVAACNLAGVTIDAPPYALLGDIQRQLGRALPRRTRRLLPELCRQIVASGQDPERFARAARMSMYRMAAIAAGDVSLVLADMLGRPRRQLSLARDERAQRLIAFVLSPDYLELRELLGMGIQ